MSEKHKNIIRMLAMGCTAKEIADAIGYKERTIEVYLADLRFKHEAKNTTHLVAKCLREGIIQ